MLTNLLDIIFFSTEEAKCALVFAQKSDKKKKKIVMNGVQMNEVDWGNKGDPADRN